MAKNSSVNLDITNNADGWDLTGGTTGRKLTVTGSNITLTGSGSNTYTLPSSTDTLVGRDSTDTLTNKTLTAPKLANGGFIADANGNEGVILITTASAVNEVTVTPAATGGTPSIIASGETNVHLQVAGKGNGLTKVSVLRQDDTSNSYKHNSVILTGWGVIVATATTVLNETVTFGITFAQRPIVVNTFGGDNTSGTLTYGAGTAARNNAYAEAHSVTTTSFQSRLISAAAWTNGDSTFYQWVAFGEL